MSEKTIDEFVQSVQSTKNIKKLKAIHNEFATILKNNADEREKMSRHIRMMIKQRDAFDKTVLPVNSNLISIISHKIGQIELGILK